MLTVALNKALSYYDSFDYLTIVDKQGIIEYAAVYDKNQHCFVNQNTTGMHILEMYSTLKEESSTILKALTTGKEIYNTLQSLKYYDNNHFFLLSSDFPIINDGVTTGVIEVSVSLNSKTYTEYLDGNYAPKKKTLFTLNDIISKDPNLLEIKDNVSKIANTNSPVFIVGETGTGKNIIAESVHSHSSRSNKPFIAQNCAAIPSSLLESTFFGTVKGAYTGSENSIGLFELAKEGTLFLDEINSMDIGLQAKLLKAVEDKKIRRVGGTKDIETDVRIISAININPNEAIAKNLLRKDLFYRLGVVQLELPPLRERVCDIELLLNHFINKYNMKMHKNIDFATEQVIKIFQRYPWDGNVRELENIIESAFNITKDNTIKIDDIPSYLYKDNSGSTQNINIFDNTLSLSEKLFLVEKEILAEALREEHTLSDAAKRLGISPQALQHKLKKFDFKSASDFI